MRRRGDHLARNSAVADMPISFNALIARAVLAILVLLAVAVSPAGHSAAHGAGDLVAASHTQHVPDADHSHADEADPSHAHAAGEPSHDTPGLADLRAVPASGSRNESPVPAFARLWPNDRHGLERPPRPYFAA